MLFPMVGHSNRTLLAHSCQVPTKGGEFTSNRREGQEILMLSLHLLQVSLVYVNTL